MLLLLLLLLLPVAVVAAAAAAVDCTTTTRPSPPDRHFRYASLKDVHSRWWSIGKTPFRGGVMFCFWGAKFIERTEGRTDGRTTTTTTGEEREGGEAEERELHGQGGGRG